MDRYSTRIGQFLTAIHRRTRGFVSTLFFGVHYSMRKYSFFVLCSYGLAGSFIDVDHFFIAQTNMVRPAHLPFLVLVWVVSIGYYTYLDRRVYSPGMT